MPDSQTLRALLRNDATLSTVLCLAEQVAGHCVPADAVADVVQDVMTQLLQSRARPADLKAFVATVTRRRARRFYRALKQQPDSLSDAVPAPARTPPSPSCRARNWLAEVLLPRLIAIRAPRGSRSGHPTPREIVVIAALAAGVASCRHLARELGMSPGTVRRIIISAQAKILALDVPPPDTW